MRGHRKTGSVSSQMPLRRRHVAGFAPVTSGRDAHKGRQDAPARPERAAQIARDLRHSASAAAMSDRQLDYAQPGASRPHLHLKVPAVGCFAHAEAHQRIAADRPERAHVGVMNPVEQAHREADHPAGKELMNGHAARLPLSAGARADHEVTAALSNRLDDVRDQFGAVAAVAVKKHDDVAIPGGLGAGATGTAIAVLAQAHDAGTGCLSALDGAIGTAAVDHDDVVDHRARHGGDDAADRFFFIEGRDDERDPRLGHLYWAILKGSNAVRNWRRPAAACRSTERCEMPDSADRSRSPAGFAGWHLPT